VRRRNGRGCALGPEGATAIAAGLRHTTGLEVLDLRCARRAGFGVPIRLGLRSAIGLDSVQGRQDAAVESPGLGALVDRAKKFRIQHACHVTRVTSALFLCFVMMLLDSNIGSAVNSW
jgi:hypothetical protein